MFINKITSKRSRVHSTDIQHKKKSNTAMTIYFGKFIYCSSKALLSICEVQTWDKSLRPGMYLSKSPFLLLPYSLDIFHDEIFMLSVISEDNSEDLNIPS